MAPPPGASSSSIRASTSAPAGCTRPAASTMSTSSPRRSSGAATGLFYRYGGRCARSAPRRSTLRVRQPDGSLAARRFTTYATHHGPIVRGDSDRWIAMALMHRPVEALQQSWLRTRARNFDDYLRVAALQANSSNDTIYADADGRIAYLHPQFLPIRDDRFDYRGPVDGSDPATDWRGLTPLDRLPTVRDPRAGWLYNANDSPWRAAGPDSPREADFPRYMDNAGANPRGDHAIALLTARAGADRRRRCAASPTIRTCRSSRRRCRRSVRAWEALPASDPLRAPPAGPGGAAARLGPALVGRVRADDARHLLGDRDVDARRAPPGAARQYVGDDPRPCRPRPDRDLRRRRRAAGARMGRLAGRLGRGQPLPAQRRRDPADFRRHAVPASPSPSPRRAGAASPPSPPAPIPARGAGTAPAATASSRSSSSARASAPGRSAPAARAATPLAAISTIRPAATRRAICARSISIPTSSPAMSSGPTAPANEPPEIFVVAAALTIKSALSSPLIILEGRVFSLPQA